MFRFIILALVAVSVAAGGCDNACSGHGTCMQNGVCACYDNWGMGLGLDSGDCSQRVCPFEFAWVDTPDKLGNHHKYAECSNRGICDRDSGECDCFPGYEGKGCARTSCPNDCSGHGRCKSIEDLPFQATPQQYDVGNFFPQKAHSFGDTYKNWDAEKTRGCVCDAEYGDVDCSKRLCMHGNDIMDQRDDITYARQNHVQHIQFVADNNDANVQVAGVGSRSGLAAKTFALTFTSRLNETFTTIPIKFAATDSYQDYSKFFLAVEHALEALPNNVIDNVDVMGELRETSAAWSSSEGDSSLGNAAALNGFDYDGTSGAKTSPNAVYMNVTFSGTHVQGPQNLLTVKHIHCGDGCTPKLDGLDLMFDTMDVISVTHSASGQPGTDYNSYECGRRGKCDYSSGQCACFNGYSGLACGTITSLV